MLKELSKPEKNISKIILKQALLLKSLERDGEGGVKRNCIFIETHLGNFVCIHLCVLVCMCMCTCVYVLLYVYYICSFMIQTLLIHHHFLIPTILYAYPTYYYFIYLDKYDLEKWAACFFCVCACKGGTCAQEKVFH